MVAAPSSPKSVAVRPPFPSSPFCRTPASSFLPKTISIILFIKAAADSTAFLIDNNIGLISSSHDIEAIHLPKSNIIVFRPVQKSAGIVKSANPPSNVNSIFFKKPPAALTFLFSAISDHLLFIKPKNLSCFSCHFISRADFTFSAFLASSLSSRFPAAALVIVLTEPTTEENPVLNFLPKPAVKFLTRSVLFFCCICANCNAICSEAICSIL